MLAHMVLAIRAGVRRDEALATLLESESVLDSLDSYIQQHNNSRQQRQAKPSPYRVHVQFVLQSTGKSTQQHQATGRLLIIINNTREGFD